MTLQTYILCGVAALFGQLIHVFAIKIPSAKTRANSAKITFTIGYWLGEEWPVLAGNFATIVFVLLIAGEAIAYKPSIQPFIVTMFGCIGFIGSNVALALFSKVGAKLNEVTNINVNATSEDDQVNTIKK